MATNPNSKNCPNSPAFPRYAERPDPVLPLLSASLPTVSKAREFYSRWDLIFAAKIRSECSLYQYSSGAFELDVANWEG